MGERLLRDEGFEVVTLTDGDSVLVRLPDVDPDVLILDANLPLRNGYEIARFVKNSAFYRHAGVVLTGSAAEPVDGVRARESGAEAVLMKPFEAQALLGLVGPMAARAESLRESRPAGPPPPAPGDEPEFVSGVVEAEPEPEYVPEPEPAPVAPLVQLAPLGVKVVAEVEPEAVSEAERVRAAVTLALDAAMPQIIEELTQQTLRALHSN
jgi:CheY-like chemotaxis protein